MVELKPAREAAQSVELQDSGWVCAIEIDPVLDEIQNSAALQARFLGLQPNTL